MLREIFVGICVGIGTFLLKLVASMDLYSMLFFVPILILLGILTLWIYFILMSENNISEIAALAAGVSNITVILLGVFVLGEAFGIRRIFGAAIIIVGMVILKFKKSSTHR